MCAGLYGHPVLSEVQAAEMGFLRRDHGVTRIKVRWRPRQESSLAPSSLNLRSFGSKCTVLKKKLAIFLGLFSTPSDSEPGTICLTCSPRYIPGVTLRENVRSCEIYKTLNVEPIL